MGGLGGIGGLAFIVVGAMAPPGARLPFFTLGLSVLAVSLGLGFGLAWHGGRSLQGRSSRRFAPRRLGAALGLFLLVVALGQVLLSGPEWRELAFPPFHVLATTLPSLILLALVSRGLAAIVTWRELVLQLSSGAILATALAFVLQVGLLMLLVAAVLLGVAMQPNGLASLQAWAERVENPALWQEPGASALARPSPWLVVGVLVFAGVVVPSLEEAIKTVGVGLMSYRRPTRTEAFLWGVVGGAGFALTESLLNSLGAGQAWAPAVLLRTGTTILHCTTGGITGLAWHALLAERKGWRALGLYIGAVSLHGLWNSLAVGITFLSFPDAEGILTGGVPSRMTAGIVPLMILLALLAVGAALALRALTRHLRRAAPMPAGAPTQVPAPPKA